jgi:hypothetical protein
MMQLFINAKIALSELDGDQRQQFQGAESLHLPGIRDIVPDNAQVVSPCRLHLPLLMQTITMLN